MKKYIYRSNYNEKQFVSGINPEFMNAIFNAGEGFLMYLSKTKRLTRYQLNRADRLQKIHSPVCIGVLNIKLK